MKKVVSLIVLIGLLMVLVSGCWFDDEIIVVEPTEEVTPIPETPVPEVTPVPETPAPEVTPTPVPETPTPDFVPSPENEEIQHFVIGKDFEPGKYKFISTSEYAQLCVFNESGDMITFCTFEAIGDFLEIELLEGQTLEFIGCEFDRFVEE